MDSVSGPSSASSTFSMSISSLCTPAVIYVVISVITLIIGAFYKFQPLTLIVKVFFVMLWTWFLNFLCNKGYTGISWFLVLLPFIILLVSIVILFEVTMRTVAKGKTMPTYGNNNGNNNNGNNFSATYGSN